MDKKSTKSEKDDNPNDDLMTNDSSEIEIDHAAPPVPKPIDSTGQNVDANNAEVINSICELPAELNALDSVIVLKKQMEKKKKSASQQNKKIDKSDQWEYYISKYTQKKNRKKKCNRRKKNVTNNSHNSIDSNETLTSNVVTNRSRCDSSEDLSGIIGVSTENFIQTQLANNLKDFHKSNNIFTANPVNDVISEVLPTDCVASTSSQPHTSIGQKRKNDETEQNVEKKKRKRGKRGLKKKNTKGRNRKSSKNTDQNSSCSLSED